jgi:hypothetical protein
MPIGFWATGDASSISFSVFQCGYVDDDLTSLTLPR